MSPIKIGKKLVGPGQPTFLVAEMSGNHNQSLDAALELVHAAAEAGADAIKLQTYTAETMTIQSKKKWFTLQSGTLWDGKTLFDLYQEAHTPWEWHQQLIEESHRLGMECFSTPFDSTAVDFLMDLNTPVFKVASFENTDLPLLKKIAATGRPVILSTGLATQQEIDEAVTTLKSNGCTELILLKCTSSYPAPVDEAHLKSIPFLAENYGVFSGLSDHTMGSIVPTAAVALGACMVEKHFCLSRSLPGPDSAFSMEPAEFKKMVDEVRLVEQALGRVNFGPTPAQKKSLVFRRSLFVTKSIAAGEVFSLENVRVIRPGDGLAPKYYEQVLSQRATTDIEEGTPLSWELVDKKD
ncbi:MAG: pseudaminic acid synthase [Polyangiaceae bacterium]|nr:pseudaminic acid synthase [Polyangiaceae bacterium]